MIDIANSEFMKQEFEMGGREWRINKLPPLIAKDVLVEHVRPCLIAADGTDFDSDSSLIALIGKLPTHHLKALGKTFAKYSIKTRNDGGQWVAFSSDPENFAKDIDPLDLVLLDARALMVNFGQSVSDAVARFRGLPAMEADDTPNP